MINAPYKLFDTVKDQLEKGLLFVEIGSERGGGSTNYLSALARDTSNEFITIDVDPVRLSPSIKAATMSGEDWVSNELPSTSKARPKIGLVYLDNFDWIYRPTDVRNGEAEAEIYNNISEYAKRGIKLNNINSAVSHLVQVKGMMPFMHSKCVVMFSDTWFNPSLDTFEGKGSAAVYLLMTEGFSVVSASPSSNYIMMCRNLRPKENQSNIKIDSLSEIYSPLQKVIPNNLMIYMNSH